MSSDDALYDKVARKVVAETLRLKKGETITIEAWNKGLPLARRLVVEAKRIGAIPVVVFEDESAYVEGVRLTPKDVLGNMGKHEYALLAGSDAYVFIPGPPIGAYSPLLSRQEVVDSTKYNASWYEAAGKARLRGARLPFGYVGKEYARLYRKKPEEMVHHQLRAALADLPSISASGRAVGQALQDGAHATLLTSGGKLEFDLRGDLEVEDGLVDEDDVAGGYNMTYVPPGYVSKQVDTASAKGTVALSSSVTRLGLLEDARLEFEGGKLVGWKSRGSQKMLAELVEAVPPEKRALSSVVVGLNPLMRYENGQDRMVSGGVGLVGFGFMGTVRRGSLSVGGKAIVEKGKLATLG
ncbi:MAG TPA: aminopeptidase [Nitrososphaerales archaeon]|nr:aminopeptidase [Nitrososphaerales archaeon]